MIGSIFAIGWNAGEQVHNSMKTRNAVIGDAYGYLMNGGDGLTRRFASTVLDALGFTQGIAGTRSVGGSGWQGVGIDGTSGSVRAVHRKNAGVIYSKHLAKPFMGDDEFCDFLLWETLEQKPEYLRLMTEDTRIEV